LGAFLAGAGAFWGSYHQHQVFEYEKQLTEKSEVVIETQEKLDKTQEKLNQSEDKISEIEGDPLKIAITPENMQAAQDLSKNGESVGDTIARAIEFYANPPVEVGSSPSNTESGTVLEFDRKWRTNGIAATIRNPRRKSGCSGAFLEFDIKVENLTGKGKNLGIQGRDLVILVDGVPQSNYRWSWNAIARRNCVKKGGIYASANDHLVPGSASFDIGFLEARQSKTVYYAVFGDLTSTSKEIVVQIDDSDPIDGAKWKVPVGDI